MSEQEPGRHYYLVCGIDDAIFAGPFTSRAQVDRRYGEVWNEHFAEGKPHDGHVLVIDDHSEGFGPGGVAPGAEPEAAE